MGFNRQRKHVLFYAEDEATANIAQGFVESLKIDDSRCRVFHQFGHGWPSIEGAIECVKMNRHPQTHLVLVVDCDRRGVDRIKRIKSDLQNVPCKDHVYVLGLATDAEGFGRFMAEHVGTRSYSLNEAGCALGDASSADEGCLSGIWGTPELTHNRAELIRLCENAKDVIFK